jgi:hypothetical protein
MSFTPWVRCGTAARIALRAVDAFLQQVPQIERVLLICFHERTRAICSRARQELGI